MIDKHRTLRLFNIIKTYSMRLDWCFISQDWSVLFPRNVNFIKLSDERNIFSEVDFRFDFVKIWKNSIFNTETLLKKAIINEAWTFGPEKK